MDVKIISSVVLSGLVCVSAHATSINMRHEIVPKYDDQAASHSDRIEVSHRFSNGIGFGVEAKWKSNNESAFGELSGNGQQSNISYRIKLSDDLTFTPQYKWESGSSKLSHQFNFSFGYKVSSDWSVGFRHRYNYEAKVDDDNSHYNRWTFSAGYKGVEDWSLSSSIDYTFNPEASGPRWEDKQSWFSDVNFKGEYTGLNNGWKPFLEFGLKPYKSGETYRFNGEDVSANDKWRPRYRLGLKYSY